MWQSFNSNFWLNELHLKPLDMKGLQRSFSPSFWCLLRFKSSVSHWRSSSQPKLLKQRERTNNHHDVTSVMFSVLGKAIYSPSTNTSALLPLKVPNCVFLLPFHFHRARWMLFCGGDRPGSPPLLVIDGRDAFSLSARPESPASAAQLHRRRLHPLLQLHHRPPLFTSTCIREDCLEITRACCNLDISSAEVKPVLN